MAAGPRPIRVTENDASVAKENEWSTAQDEVKPSPQTYSNPPFKSIQCAVADSKTTELKKSKHGGIPVSRLSGSQLSASIMHKTPGIFSFNATYMSTRADSDLDSDFNDHVDTTTTTPKLVMQQFDLSRRTFLAPLLKPAPSKWDDAEKWLPGSECQSARAKSRSGPLLAQMVVAQNGMSIPNWKGPAHILNCAQTERHVGGVATLRGEAVEGTDSGAGSVVDVKDVQTSLNLTVTPAVGLVDFTADEKQQLNLLLDRYSVMESVGSEEFVGGDGGTSPSCLNGSFLKLGARMEKPLVVEFSPTPGELFF